MRPKRIRMTTPLSVAVQVYPNKHVIPRFKQYKENKGKHRPRPRTSRNHVLCDPLIKRMGAPYSRITRTSQSTREPPKMTPGIAQLRDPEYFE